MAGNNAFVFRRPDRNRERRKIILFTSRVPASYITIEIQYSPESSVHCYRERPRCSVIQLVSVQTTKRYDLSSTITTKARKITRKKNAFYTR